MNKHIKGGIVLLSFFIYPFFVTLPFELLNWDIEYLSINLKIIYLISFNMVFLCSLLIIYNKDVVNYFYDFKKNGQKYMKKSLKYWYIGLLIMITANGLINNYTPNEIAKNEEALRNMLNIAPLYVLFSTVLYAPIVEEIICRKVLKDIINYKWPFIIASSLLFGGAHVLGSITSLWSLLYIIPYGALGGAFAYAYYKTNNLLTPIFLHALHNGILISIYLIVF